VAGKTISTTVNKPVTLGVGGYTSPLTITSTGEIQQNPNDIAGLTSVAALNVLAISAGAIIVNDGQIRGGEGIYQENDIGGDGVSMAAAATLTNALLILGGAGGTANGNWGSGGAGLVASAGGVITNTGLVLGGAGGDGGDLLGGSGGAGMVLTGATLTNSGTLSFDGIEGGAGGGGYDGGYGGAGLAMTNSRATNSSFIGGGQGGNGPGRAGLAGDGVDLAGGGTLTNLAGGRILGGGSGASVETTYGGIGVNVNGQGKAAYLANAGTITGGAGAPGVYPSDNEVGGGGGTGVLLQGTLTSFLNTGTVFGGAGGAATGSKAQSYYVGGYGAVGLEVLTGVTATNEGEIAGGAGGYGSNAAGIGGVGVEVTGNVSNKVIQYAAFYNLRGATVRAGADGGTSSHGTIESAPDQSVGVFARYAQIYNAGYIYGGAGNQGVNLFGSYLQNSGDIFGGTGGAYGIYLAGGRAVNLRGGGIYGGVADVGGALTNYGYITGNPGASAGVGVNLFGGVLINGGIISGGVIDGTSQTGDAVDCTDAATVVAAPGARFYGNVVDYTGGAGSVLEVTGAGGDRLSGVGTQFTGFNTVSFATGAAWTISGDVAGLASGQVIDGFGLGDGIVLTGVAEQGAALVGTQLDLFVGSSTDYLDFSSYLSTAGVLLVTNDGTNTTLSQNATVTNATAANYGLALVMQGGVANKLVIGYQSQLTVSSGGQVKGLEIGNTGYGNVFTGGFVSNVLLNTGSYLAVLQGGTLSGATVQAGGVLDLQDLAVASNVTLAGGELLDQGAKLTGKVSFAAGPGVLDIEQTNMPTTEIFGFAVGDKIILSDAAASSGKVKVSKAGVVTITAGGKTYKLNISGAKVGATNYKFANDTLTETKKATAAFLRPEAGAAAPSANALPALSSAGAYPLITAAARQAGAGIWLHGGLVQEPWRPAQDAFAAMVTFQS